MAEIKIPGGNPFSWKEFNNDCKTYHEAKERLKKIGVNTEQDAIVYLQREVDYYRDKIRHMEERNKMRTDAVDAFKYATMSVMPAEAIQVKMPILESIPKDMRDRIYSIEQTADGNVTVYFDIAEKETKKTMNIPEITAAKMICKSVDALTREVYLLRKDILEGWKLNAEIEELDKEPKQIPPPYDPQS